MPERHKILIVDDNAQDRQAVARILRGEAAFDIPEAEVQEAETVSAAREALRREEFACVFLDHNLPDGTALDMLMEVRAQGLATPVIVLTGQRDEQIIAEVMQAGAVDYLPKERLHPDLVARSLRIALRFLQTQREKAAAMTELRARDRAIAAVSNGIVIADPRQPDCPIIYTNQAFLRMTGYDEAEVIGRNCRFLQGPDTDPAAVGKLRDAIRVERTCQVSIRNYRKNGTAFWNEVTVSPVRDAQGRLTHFVGVQTDVTDRNEAETERRRTEEALRRSREDLRLAIDAARLGTFYCDYPLDKIVWNATCSEHFFLPPDAEVNFDIFYSRLHPDDLEPTRRAIERAMTDRVAYDVEYRTMAPDGRTRWINAVGRFYYDPDGQPARFDGITIDIAARKAAEEELRRQAERDRFLAELTERARAMSDPDEVIADAVQSIGRFLGASRCLFADINLETDICAVRPDYRADSSVASMAGAFPISAFGPYLVGEYRAGRIVAAEDVWDDPARFLPGFVESYDAVAVRAFIAVPVLHSARLVSVLAIHSSVPRRWMPDEVALAQAVMERTWLTVEVLRQQRALAREAEVQRTRAEREALLNRIGAAIRQDPDQVLATAMRELGQALGADRCYYAAYDQEADTALVGPDWHRDSLSSIAGLYAMSPFRVNRDPVYKAGHTQVVPDTTGDEATVALGLRALVRVPLVAGASMTALAAAMTDSPRAWTADEIALIESVATQTQTALEAVQMQRREHRIAEQLQDALQPPLPEHIPGLSVGKFTRPALDEAKVGGDFYDIFPLDKNLYAVVLGDVSGKGLAAAQQLALIRNSLRTTLYLHRAPAQAATTLNGIVTAHDLLVGFVTVWVGVYDAATGRVAYCSCGHEPGLVRRADGAKEVLETTGPPLGVAESAEYSESSLTLFPGDSLLLYTDGMSEAGPNRREMLGTDGLMRLLGTLPSDMSAAEQAAALVREVSAYTNDIFRDDVAVLLACRQ